MTDERAIEFLEHGIRINADTPLGMALAIGILVGIPLIVRWAIKRNMGNSAISEVLFWLVVAGMIMNLSGVKLDELLMEIIKGG